MSFKKFCPKCGKETSSFAGKICLNCFMDKNEIFTIDKINISKCKHCLKILDSGTWIDFSEEEIAEMVAKKVKVVNEVEEPKIFVELEKFDNINYEALVEVKGIISNSVVTEQKSIKFQIKETTCDACMKLNSEYREAIIQLRSEKRENEDDMFTVAKNLLMAESSKDALSGTSKIEKVRNGYDLWVGSKKAAAKVSRELSRMYGTRIVNSKKLIGEDDQGKRKYRHTFCVRDYKED
jgi:NMD protein affecting ribosome stability and mRNA decay